jgi:two-component system response regulator FlrC
VLLAGDGGIGPEHVIVEEPARGLAPLAPTHTPSLPANGSLWEMERDLIMHTLDRVKGNRTHAAKVLGISIRTLRNKLREYRQLAHQPAVFSPGPQAEC